MSEKWQLAELDFFFCLSDGFFFRCNCALLMDWMRIILRKPLRLDLNCNLRTTQEPFLLHPRAIKSLFLYSLALDYFHDAHPCL